jgi:hypothetical protein
MAKTPEPPAYRLAFIARPDVEVADIFRDHGAAMSCTQA